MMTAAGVVTVSGGRFVAAVRGVKDSILPMVRVFLSVAPEHNATPPSLDKATRGLTER
jgi:hypothetical protein